MQVKTGVNIWSLQFEMRKVLVEADKVYKKYGKELVITSARDGIHSARSLHYFGYAVDLRTNYFTAEQIPLVLQDLKLALGPAYDVLFETDHFHVEYKVGEQT